MSAVRFWGVAIGLCVCTSAAVVVGVRALRPAPVPIIMPVAQTPPPRLDIVSVLKAMQLVTVEIEAGVKATSADDSWRGDVFASVLAPVRYYYAVDLSALKPGDVQRNALTGELSLSVPGPKRLAVEILGDKHTEDVSVSGIRFRDVAGEYHLGLARTRLYDQARKAELSDHDRARLIELSRRQLEALVASLSTDAKPARVRVTFADDPGKAQASASGQ